MQDGLTSVWHHLITNGRRRNLFLTEINISTGGYGFVWHMLFTQIQNKACPRGINEGRELTQDIPTAKLLDRSCLRLSVTIHPRRWWFNRKVAKVEFDPYYILAALVTMCQNTKMDIQQLSISSLVPLAREARFSLDSQCRRTYDFRMPSVSSIALVPIYQHFFWVTQWCPDRRSPGFPAKGLVLKMCQNGNGYKTESPKTLIRG